MATTYGLLRMNAHVVHVFNELDKAEEKAKRLVEQFKEDVGIFELISVAKDPMPAIEIIPVIKS